jgi:hypothetical protein
MTVSESIAVDLLKMVQKHDYSYMMSDDHRSWESGMRYEKEIQAKIHALCSIHKEDAVALLEDCLNIRPEQYIDGLTHRVIKSWFAPYVGK